MRSFSRRVTRSVLFPFESKPRFDMKIRSIPNSLAMKYYSDSLISLAKNMLCSKLNCHQDFDSILFSHGIGQHVSQRLHQYHPTQCVNWMVFPKSIHPPSQFTRKAVNLILWQGILTLSWRVCKWIDFRETMSMMHCVRQDRGATFACSTVEGPVPSGFIWKEFEPQNFWRWSLLHECFTIINKDDAV